MSSVTGSLLGLTLTVTHLRMNESMDPLVSNAEMLQLRHMRNVLRQSKEAWLS